MSLKDLLHDYLHKPDLAERFDRDPDGAFEKYQVAADLRIELVTRDLDELAAKLDKETWALLKQVHDKRPYTFLLYPDVDLRICSITPSEDLVAGDESYDLYYELTWDHMEVPDGLPQFALIHIEYIGTEGSMEPREDRTTPVLVDLLGRLSDAGGTLLSPIMALREPCKFPLPGDYHIRVSIDGYPAKSDPFTLTVKAP